ncbi:Transcription factor GLABRA 3 [Linum perenne]
MASGNINKQLALAVRSIQWSYAIFWSISAEQPGVLSWGDGYYNGDIKTRKTVQTMEVEAEDEFGLQRSVQLRELYESLSAGEANTQTRRPSAALSPEDLTDTEWYYLVCMSFLFNIGNGLPGRSMANSEQIWLCNAHSADCKVFTRSLLAKSASIQTVVCFPILRGVLEIGSTEKVSENYSLIQQIRSLFLDNPDPLTSEKWIRGQDEQLEEICMEARLVPGVECEELGLDVSPYDSSNNGGVEDSFVVEGIGCEDAAEASQVESWLVMDENFSPGANHSLNSSESISQTTADREKLATFASHEKMNLLQESEACGRVKFAAPGDDLHYQSALSSIFKTSHPLMLGPHSRDHRQESSFISWKVGLMKQSQKVVKCGTQQNMLKKVLFDVPQNHIYFYSRTPENGTVDGVLRSEADECGMNHILSEMKQRELLDQRFMVLKSIVPSVNKVVDEVSILDETIEYLQELERRVDQLQSQLEKTDSEARTDRKHLRDPERTSDNYRSINQNGYARTTVGNKIQKLSEINETRPKIEPNASVLENVTVSMNMKDIIIKVHCPWREGILLEIMDELARLELDSHTVQSSTTDGILSSTIEIKQKGLTGKAAAASPRAIKRALERVTMEKNNTPLIDVLVDGY